MKGPTQRTLAELRRQGYRADVVERWIPHANQRKDLFDVIDVVAIGNGETIGVQCTSDSHVANRVHKLTESDAIADLRDSGWRLLVWGWRSKMVGRRKRWIYREVDVS